MDSETVEKLIVIVRRYVFLYDLSHQQYKNASLKFEIWESIGKELNTSGEAVRSKWKTIRDGYTKYKKQLKSSSGSSKKNVSYTWAPQLAFLDNFNVPCSNVLLEASKSSPHTQISSLDSEHLQKIKLKYMPSPLPSTSSQVPPSSHILNPESSDSITASTSRIMSHNNKRPSDNGRGDDDNENMFEFVNSKKKKELDAIDSLFLSYADTFKKFPAREQAIVKLELAKLFSNTELQLLNSNVANDVLKFNYSLIRSPYVGEDTTVKSSGPDSMKQNTIDVLKKNKRVSNTRPSCYSLERVFRLPKQK